MNDFNTTTIAMQILTSILTGGFVLILVEIGNRKNRSIDIHYQVMQPYMKKLSAYFRFMHWMHYSLKYPDKREMTGYEEEFRFLVNKMQRLGSELITSERDYPIDYFKIQEHVQISNDMNNIWYNYDRMNPRRISFEKRVGFRDDFIDDELAIINPIFLSFDKDEELVVKVSEDFYLNWKSPIEYEIYRNQNCLSCCKVQSYFAVAAVLLITTIMTLLLFESISIYALKIITVIVVVMFVFSILSLCVDQTFLIGLFNTTAKQINKLKRAVKRK